METKTITVDLGFLSPDNTSISKYENFMDALRMQILMKAIDAGDVEVAIHILERELIDDSDTSDSGDVYEAVLRHLEKLWMKGDVKLPMLQAIVASVNAEPDALDYLSENEVLKDLILDALSSNIDPAIIGELADINAGIFWNAEDIAKLVRTPNSDNLYTVIVRHPIDDNVSEILQKLQEIEREISSKDAPASALENVALIQSSAMM